ncbi:hypothetical protein G6F36_006673 [Rhizopus arrhizus]|nr:hypothetical protein G6F36_006673 [Rhizopus arrhizus]
MANKKSSGSRAKWNSFNWDTSDLDDTPVVHATLDSLTNDFKVTQLSSRQWDQQDVWESHEQSSGRFSNIKEPTATFRLNLDIPDAPVFSKVVDYSSFRDQEIVPDYDDIMMTTATDEFDDYRMPIPDVPVNQVRSPYESAEQYLYTHYELMRHDFLIPLRNAVKGYKKDYAAIKGKEDLSVAMEKLAPAQKPFRLYEHVQLNAIVFGTRQPLYRISFRLPYYVRVQWAQSKRLMPGSLVLLSKDHFETDLKVATIVDRGEEPMQGPNRFEYMLDLYLERDNDEQPLGFGDPTLSDKDNYVMIEATDGYFEAYRHILKVLQKVKSDELPFSPYIVNLSKETLVPHYAAKKRIYDANVYKTSHRGERWPIDIMGAWPEYNTGMDKTQLDALKTILSRNLSIIQGPPGSGKTFVGTYAMRVLLNNFNESLGPIVCICQTNHALDQFLEHILTYNDKIVRVGGRSKSELLKQHTLYEHKKQLKGPHGIGRLYRSRDDVVKKIKETLIQLYEEPCVTLDFVKSIQGLRPRQLDCLKAASTKEKEKKETRQQQSAQSIDSDSDSDEEWEITSVLTAAKKPQQQSGRRDNNKMNKNNTRGLSNTNNLWQGGNPNRNQEVKEKVTNPIEIWLKDAIDFVSDGNLGRFNDERKEELLEQTKGKVYEDMIDEEDNLIDEEEMQDIQLNFKGEELSDARKNPFIPLGTAYQRLTESGPGERPGRKVVNYQKSEKRRDIGVNFNFFDESEEEKDVNGQNMWGSLPDGNDAVERWMKEDDVFMWPLAARLKAHKRWIELRNQGLEAALRHLMTRYTEISKEIRTIMAKFEAKVCRENRVVGMTSTAAAKYHDLLEEMRPRILIVEEAAEMLESHIISALTTSLEHLILIGDHQQLRPSTSVHKLSEVHGLSISLFERLVMNQFPFTRLSHQRRMRPEIRQLINPIYRDPPLQDHPDVIRYPAIRGVAQSLFFLSHNEDEHNLPDSASKVNEHEAKFAAKLSFYLMQQGYSASKITIITMYSGQKTLLKKFLREARRPNMDTDTIQVSSVDGYQGEENEIIILSLVRSNTQGQIGFLKAANRVCVALSRAKHGMYILGNASLLCEKSELWNEIIAGLEERQEKMIGTSLPLKCVKHNTVTQVQWASDFVEVPEGGCSRPCGEKLDCGHECLLNCHPYEHDDILCKQSCGKILECKHPCTRRCYEKCGPCLTRISVRLPCGDFMDDECGVIRSLARNPQGHRCPKCNKPLVQKK